MIETIRFHEILEARLHGTIKTFVGEQLKPATLRAMRDALFDDVRRVFSSSNVKLCNEAMGWIANQYFIRTDLNGDGMIADLVIINEYKLATFSDEDIRTLYNLFDDTAFGDELRVEQERRVHGKEQVQ